MIKAIQYVLIYASFPCWKSILSLELYLHNKYTGHIRGLVIDFFFHNFSVCLQN